MIRTAQLGQIPLRVGAAASHQDALDALVTSLHLKAKGGHLSSPHSWPPVGSSMSTYI